MGRKLTADEQKITELVRQRMKESKSTELLGFDVESVHDGRAVFRLDVRPTHKQIHGVVHGGIIAALADTTAAIAAYTAVPLGVELATLELKINFLRPVWQTRLSATANVVQRGRTIGLVECDVTDAGGRLVARASSTCMTLRGPQAQGR